MKKLLLILCLILSLCCLFVACDEGGDGTPAPDDSQNEEQNGETPEGEETPEDGETPAPHSHTWSAWETTKAATCTEKGEEKRTCACGGSETREITLKQHTAAHREATAAGCTTAGNIEYWECSVCNKYFSNSDCSTEITNKSSVVIAATRHQHVTHYAAVASTHVTAGNIEYWACADCENYFADEACTQMIADKSSVIVAVLPHGTYVLHHEAQNPTCTENGNTEYWECTECDKYFSDATCATEIADKNSVITAATGHQSVTHHEAVEETCTTAGNIEYWECTDCDCYFSDEACTNKVTNIIIAAKGHQSVTHHDRVEATCTDAGNIEHWECTDCDCYFSDEACTNKVTNIIIAAKGHQSVTHHDRVEATCTTAGNIEYWECTDCDRYFSNSACTSKITNKTSVIIAATGHQHVTRHARVEATCTDAGNIEYWECTDCDRYFSNSACTSKIEDKSTVTISATAIHTPVHHDAKNATCGTAGNAEYWECSVCNKYFSNTNCTTEIIDKSSVILPATGGCVYNTQNVCTVCGTALQATKGLVYTLNSDENSYTVKRTTALSNSTDIVIPWYYNEKPVTIIGESAFSGCRSLTSITIPSSVTSIGLYAFYDCTNLKSATIPASVTSIGGLAFYDCGKLTSVTFGENSQLRSIGNYAFGYCNSLTSITIPEGVTSIGSYAFEFCDSLKSVTFGENSQLMSIGYEAFLGCDSLTSVRTPSLEAWCNIEFVDCESNPLYYAKNLYIGDSTTPVTEIIIPNTVTAIMDYAFYHWNGTSITIPSSMTSIGYEAFYGCSLTSVTFEENSQLTSIGENAFYRCTSLTSITIPSSVTSIGDWAFLDCSSLKSVTFDENSRLTSIGNSAFSECSSLTSITIPASVTSIGNYAFSNCNNLTSVMFGTNIQLKSIGNSAFASCADLTSITIPSSVTSIGSKAFQYCHSLVSVTFENTTGWWVSQDESATSGTAVDVSVPTDNDNLLKYTYDDYYWKRTVE